MTSSFSPVIGDIMSLKFDVADRSYALSDQETAIFVQGLQVSADKASLQFKEIVAGRTRVLLKPDGNLLHDLHMWYHKGPFTADQFLGMIEYQKGISNEDWSKHMDSRVSVFKK